jgi:hypothetical protein
LLGKNCKGSDKGITTDTTKVIKDSMFNNVPESIRMRAKADSDAVLIGMSYEEIERKADSLTKVYVAKIRNKCFIR